MQSRMSKYFHESPTQRSTRQAPLPRGAFASEEPLAPPPPFPFFSHRTMADLPQVKQYTRSRNNYARLQRQRS